jgi:arylsulfatase A-like enzyme
LSRARRLGRDIAAGTLLLAVAGGSLGLAFSRGGGADPAADPPRPTLAGDSGGADSGDAGARAATTDRDYVATFRLVERMDKAKVEAPNAGELEVLLQPHWRKLRPPFVKVPRDLARYVSSVSLRTSEKEEQHSVSTQGSGSGSATGSWKPDVRLWNMNEGSFDQRESIVLTAPGSVTFPVELPEGARVTFGAGSANASRKTLLFRVSFVPTSGAAVPACETRVPPSRARLWTDVTCDFAAAAGRPGTLTLGVSQVEPTADEAPRKRVHAEGGPSEDALLEGAGQTPVALFGQPTVWGKSSDVPYNVLWVVVDALRPDVVASFHDDARDEKMLAAESPPLEALLPKIPGLMPTLDGLASSSVIFRTATSAASWTRPGTLAMLSGARSSELGIETKNWVLDGDAVGRFYASSPPLLPLLLRRRGVAVEAFVNNYFLVGYTPIGIDMAFEQVVDHRYRTKDTEEVTKSALAFLSARRDTRFFAFVNYNSPHDPYDPPAEMLARVPEPPAGPKDPMVRKYMAEGAKDDAAIGVLLAELDKLDLRRKTLVVVTADHGETLSLAHQGKSNDGIPVRFHHSASNFEETTRIPIVLSLPGVLPAGRRVDARVRSTDIAPTVLELLGLERPAKMSGQSLLALARAHDGAETSVEPEPRVAVTEGRGTRSLVYRTWHYLVQDPEASRDGGPGFAGHEFLFDLAQDPGERHDLSGSRADMLAEMRARLAAALKNVAPAGSAEAPAKAADEVPWTHVRFVGGGRVRHVSGHVKIEKGKLAEIKPVGTLADAFRKTDDGFDVTLDTAADDLVGFDVLTQPPAADLVWSFTSDERPMGSGLVFGGPFGIAKKGLEVGVTGESVRESIRAARFPEVDPRRDDGLFVARDRSGAAFSREGSAGEGAAEMARMLREWGYANGPSSSSKK